jgi:KipI family sensor histidine kinase inhibitor
MRDVAEHAGLVVRLVGWMRMRSRHSANGIIEEAMQIAPAGDRGLLVTLHDAPAARLRVAAELLRRIPPVEACVIGHESVLVIGAGSWGPIREAIATAEEGAVSPARTHRIDVSFADEYALDLPELLAKIGRTKNEFMQRLAGVQLSVRYLGFRAGFAYCDGWPREWQLPRRPTSRNRVAGGSFAVAGEMAGFYPDDSPGGWNILGRTGAALWDPSSEPPNLFVPGDAIEIAPNEDTVERTGSFALSAAQDDTAVIAEVIKPGQLTTIVGARDWSRAEHGQTPGGPFDAQAAALANRAAGNPDDAPLLECVLVGPHLRLTRRAAWCGADLRVRELKGEIDVGRFDSFRGYLAIEGGIGGSGVVKAGDLHVAPPSKGSQQPATKSRADRLVIGVKPGPHRTRVLPQSWTVTNQLDRVGIRLRPLHAIGAAPPADLPSVGVQFGTLQWHPDGSVVAMGPDHPVTGGYLQPATVISDDLWKLGQLSPGERVTLLAV